MEHWIRGRKIRQSLVAAWFTGVDAVYFLDQKGIKGTARYARPSSSFHRVNPNEAWKQYYTQARELSSYMATQTRSGQPRRPLDDRPDASPLLAMSHSGAYQ